MNGETDLVDDIVLTQMMLQLNPSLFSATIPSSEDMPILWVTLEMGRTVLIMLWMERASP